MPSLPPQTHKTMIYTPLKTDHAKGLFYGLFASVTFGFLPLFSLSLMSRGITVSSLLFYRFVFAALIMGAVILVRRVDLRVSARQFFILLLLAAMYVTSATGLVHSYAYIPSGVATTIHFIYPVIVTATMIFVFHERRSRTIFTAMGMAIAGVALLCWSSDGQPLDTRGVLWAASTVFWYASYLIIVNRTSVSRLQSMSMMFYIFVLGAALFALTTLAEGGLQPLSTGFDWGMILAVAVLSTVIPNLALLKAVKNAGPVVTSILGSAEPLTAMTIGVLWLGEGFSLRTLAGFAMVVGAVVLVILNKNRENNPLIGLRKYFSLQKQKGNLKT